MNWDALLDAICGVWHLLILWAGISGMVLFAGALIRLACDNASGYQNRASIPWMILCSILLVSFPSFIDIASATFGFSPIETPAFCLTSSELFNDFDAGNSVSQWVPMAYAIIMFIGGFSLYRGIIILKDRGRTGATLGDSIVHLIAGALLLNIQEADKVVGALFGNSDGLIASMGMI